jgi:hypothetical protein
VTLDRGLCFVEDVLAKSSPCKEILSLGGHCRAKDSQKLFISE